MYQHVSRGKMLKILYLVVLISQLLNLSSAFLKSSQFKSRCMFQLHSSTVSVDSFKNNLYDSDREIPSDGPNNLIVAPSKPPIVISISDLTGGKTKAANAKRKLPLERGALIVKSLPQILKRDILTILTDSDVEEASLIEEEYVTEEELRRAWKEHSVEPMGKPLDAFDVKEALLLLPDEDYDALMDYDGGNSVLLGQTTAQSVSSGVETIIDNEPEYFVTIQVQQPSLKQTSNLKNVHTVNVSLYSVLGASKCVE